MVEKFALDPFLKIKIEHILGSIALRFIQFAFFVCQVEGFPYIPTLSCRSLGFTSYKAFLKHKKDLELVFLPHFIHDF